VTLQFDAVFQDGVLLPRAPISLPNGTRVRVEIETVSSDDPLADVIGIAEGPTAGDAADRHDDYLYGKRP